MPRPAVIASVTSTAMVLTAALGAWMLFAPRDDDRGTPAPGRSATTAVAEEEADSVVSEPPTLPTRRPRHHVETVAPKPAPTPTAHPPTKAPAPKPSRPPADEPREPAAPTPTGPVLPQLPTPTTDGPGNNGNGHGHGNGNGNGNGHGR